MEKTFEETIEGETTEKEKLAAMRELASMNLLQDFLFGECVTGPEREWFGEFLIQKICRRRVKLTSVLPQKIVRGIVPGRHGIRMDVLLEDDENCAYDFEPDNYTRSAKAPKRARYYQALIDSRLLDSGVDYDKLKDLLIIFIQPYDMFHEGRVCYTFRRTCVESPEIPYEDGVRIIYLNTKGTTGGDEELMELLHYMEDSRAENAVSEDMKKLHQYVEEIKSQKEVGVRYMQYWEREKFIREEALKEGEARGEAQGEARGFAKGEAQGEARGFAKGEAHGIFLLLRGKGAVPPELKEKIYSNEKQENFEKWLHLAAEVTSVEEFEEKM